jgi:hypothetical protein
VQWLYEQVIKPGNAFVTVTTAEYGSGAIGGAMGVAAKQRAQAYQSAAAPAPAPSAGMPDGLEARPAGPAGVVQQFGGAEG